MGLTELMILLAVLGVLLVVASRVAGRGRPPARPLSEVPIPAELQARLRALTDRDQTITAIKELRSATGLSLRDAKEAVDRIAAGTPLPTGPAARATPVLADRVRRMLADGRDDEAVRLVTAETGLTAPEATAFVRSLRA